MGTYQSGKEKEIIVAQAGNSGGVTNEAQKFTTTEVLVVGGIVIGIAIAAYLDKRRCQKYMERKIRREVARSQELLNIAAK